jgi:hypothetical protein
MHRRKLESLYGRKEVGGSKLATAADKRSKSGGSSKRTTQTRPVVTRST